MCFTYYIVVKRVIHRKLLFIEITVATLFFAPLFSLFVSSVCLPFTSYNERNIQFIIIGKKNNENQKNLVPGRQRRKRITHPINDHKLQSYIPLLLTHL